MVRRRRGRWIAGGVAVALVLGVAAYVLSGSAAIESWVGSQLLEYGATYLEPELKFTRLTYVRPRTIVLDNVTLSSPDPDHPGQTVVILAVKRARLELTEIPRRGRPIKFSEVILEAPEIRAVATVPGGASLVGFSHLMRGSAEASANAGPLKLSDLLLMRRVEIADGRVSYDSRSAGMAPIWLDGINARMDFTPAGTTQNPGLYALATTISRKPALDLTLQGQVDVDALTVKLDKLELNLDMQEKNVHVLPSELQKLLRTFEVTGQLQVTASGMVPLADWRASTLQTKGALKGARVAAGLHRLEIGAWEWEADAGEGVLNIRKADAQLLGGELHISGTIPLGGVEPARLRLSANNLQIQQVLRSSKPGELPLYAGNLAAAITYSAPLALWNRQAAGGGTVSIREGRIDNIPLLGRIATGINNTLASNRKGLTDAADGTFSFTGEGVRFDHFTATSGMLALRGSGTIGFDGRLDLRLNGGPMEGLQNSLGTVGDVWASISDAMAGYRVSGTLEDPQVSLEVGGR
jgi:hypothetical protein